MGLKQNKWCHNAQNKSLLLVLENRVMGCPVVCYVDVCLGISIYNEEPNVAWYKESENKNSGIGAYIKNCKKGIKKVAIFG